MEKLRKILYEMIRASKTEREQMIYYKNNREILINVLLELKVQLDEKRQIQYSETSVSNISNRKRYTKRRK